MVAWGLRGTFPMSAFLFASILALSAPLPAAAQEVHAFNVVAADPASAIRAFGVQAGLQILASADDLKGKKFNSVSGNISTEQALTSLLAGTGLDHRYVGDRAVALVSQNATGDTPPPARVSGSVARSAADPSGDSVLIAQVDEKPKAKASDKDQQTVKNAEKAAEKPAQLEEVVVTGSRIPLLGGQGPQDVKIYTREQIDQSGQTSIADFVNTLPDVSIAFTESGQQIAYGITTVTLHGLPLGTTLVLINGRRVETSGAAGTNAVDAFDLNSIPLAAVERIEVLSEGSSAVYGSDAIAGVVNIVLKSNFSGLEVNAKYGGATGTDEWDTSLAWGERWGDVAAISLLGTFQDRSELLGLDRSITSNNNYTPFGGPNSQATSCNPGNIFTLDGSNLPGTQSPFAGVAPNAQGNPAQTGFKGTPGVLNQCSTGGYNSYIPATRREGMLAQASYSVSPNVELFTELLFSDVLETLQSAPPALVGFPAFDFSEFTAPASNPYNPFGETVGISLLLTELGATQSTLETRFFRPLVGVRGHFLENWEWETAAWDSEDWSEFRSTNTPNSTAIQNALNSTNPATALNPFVAGAHGSPQFLQSLVFEENQNFVGQTLSANAFLRGRIFKLPAGPVRVVLGGEYERDRLYWNNLNNLTFGAPGSADFQRRHYASFVEAQIPILASGARPEGADTLLAATLAGRYDRYDEFGGKATPQAGIEWRPVDSLLIRGTYGRSFKAPSLYDLYSPVASFQTFVVDPRLNNATEFITENLGGNPNVKPENGVSRTLGFVYSGKAIPDLRFSVTYWSLLLHDAINLLTVQTIVANENLFPNLVVRAPGQNGEPGPITEVNPTYINFGDYDVRGLDYQLSYRYRTAIGDWLPSLSATQTYHYTQALTPNTAPIEVVGEAQDTGNFSPRWKGMAAISWSWKEYLASVNARYIGQYLDYQDFPTTRMLGNEWFFDSSFRYQISGAQHSPYAPRNFYVQIGGVNVLNKLPRYSNFAFGTIGYDPAESDIRGRFIYAQIGARF